MGQGAIEGAMTHPAHLEQNDAPHQDADAIDHTFLAVL